MTPKRLLRTSAVLIFIHLLGHGGGHSTWDKPEDPKMAAVVEGMKGYSAEFMGASRSMADYFNGYSLILFGVFALTIAILWILSGHCESQSGLVRKLLYPIGIAYLYFGILECIFFFLFAAVISLLAGLLILLAAERIRNQNTIP